MENATKALLIAAGVMIGTILILIGYRLYASYKDIAEDYETQMTMQEIAKINKEFEKYLDDKEITPQKVVAAVTKAKSINEKNIDEYGKIYDIIIVQTSSINQDSTEKACIDFIKNNFDNKYQCSISYYTSGLYDGLVHIVNFIEN